MKLTIALWRQLRPRHSWPVTILAVLYGLAALADLAVLLRYERLSHRIQQYTGKDCFYLAKCSLGVWMAYFGAYQAITRWANPGWFAVVWFFMGLILWYEKPAPITPPFRNLRRLTDRPLRILLAIWYGLDLIICLVPPTGHWIALIPANVVYMSYLYFRACTPLPPGFERKSIFAGFPLLKPAHSEQS